MLSNPPFDHAKSSFVSRISISLMSAAVGEGSDVAAPAPEILVAELEPVPPLVPANPAKHINAIKVAMIQPAAIPVTGSFCSIHLRSLTIT